MPLPVIDPTKTRVLKELKHNRPLIGCRFDPTGRFLFVSSEDDTIQRFDMFNGAKTPLVGHQSWVRGMAFVASGNASPMHLSAGLSGFAAGGLPATLKPNPCTMISGDYHGKLIWWNASDDTPKPLRTIQAHDGWIRAVATNPAGTIVASCGNDHTAKLWNVADGQLIRTFEGHSSHAYNIAFHPNGKRLVSADLKGVIKDWDLETGKLVRELDAKVLHKYDAGFGADIGGIRGLSFNPSGTQLSVIGITNVSNAFAGVGNPLVVLFDWNDGKSKQLKPKDAFQGTGWGVHMHSNGFVVAAGGGGQGRIWFWNPNDASNTHTVTVPANARDMAVHPDGTGIAIAGANGVCYLHTMIPGPTAPAKK